MSVNFLLRPVGLSKLWAWGFSPIHPTVNTPQFLTLQLQWCSLWDQRSDGRPTKYRNEKCELVLKQLHNMTV